MNDFPDGYRGLFDSENVPAMKNDSFDAKKETRAATSSGVPRLLTPASNLDYQQGYKNVSVKTTALL